MEGPVKASLGKRFLALAIDLLLFSAVIQVSFIFITFIILYKTNFADLNGKHNGFLLFVISFLIGNALSFVIFSFKDVFNGVSLGKKITKIAIREKDAPNKVPSFPKLVLRNLLLIVWPIDLFILARHSGVGDRIGDRLFNTHVIEITDEK